jgi:hypothetical protein
LAGLAVFAAAWLPAGIAGAANSPTFRDCSFGGGFDPDFVQLMGAAVGPGGMLTVSSAQSSVTIEASESADPGDNLGHDTFSVTVGGTGIAPKMVSGMGTGHVTLTVPLSGVAAGGQYTLDWSAVFDGGFHACPGSSDPQNPSSNPFVLNVVGGAPPPPVPAITSLTESHHSWRVTKGTSFSFNLNEAAQVQFMFRHIVGGRSVVAGTMTTSGVAGMNHIRFHGRISGGPKLKPGRYTLVVTATNSAGESSTAKSIAFTIKRPSARRA